MKGIRIALATTLLLTLTALAGCGSARSAGDQGAAPAATAPASAQQQVGKKLKVAYVIAGSLGDKSVFDSGKAGLDKAQAELGVDVKVIPSAVAAEWEPNLKAAAAGGYDLIVAGDAQMHGALAHVAPTYPNQKFVCLDDVVDAPNVASTRYARHEGAFLAGALAALMSRTHTIGWVGLESAALQNLLEGYKQGAAAVDPHTKVLFDFAPNPRDQAKGKELALAQYSQGADVVMNVAGGAAPGVIAAAREAGKFAIGAGSDQDSEAPGLVLASLLTHVDTTVYEMIKAVAGGTWKAGVYNYGLKNNGVGLTDMHVIGERVPKAVRERLAELTKQVGSGEIRVKEFKGS